MIKPVILPTDFFLFLLVLLMGFFLWQGREKPLAQKLWLSVLSRKGTVIALVILSFFLLIALLDSIHYRQALAPAKSGKIYYSVKTLSLLDTLIYPVGAKKEQSYSAPLALYAYNKRQERLADGRIVYDYPRLAYSGMHLKNNQDKTTDITQKSLMAILTASGLWVLFVIGLWFFKSFMCGKKNNLFAKQENKKSAFTINPYRLLQYALTEKVSHATEKNLFPVKTFYLTVWCLLFFICLAFSLGKAYHLLGTDSIGEDVFYQTVKSIRTALVIGTLTTLIMLPLAIMLATVAGYFKGWVDDLVQYLYTTLSAIPGVLLIVASVLMLQVIIEKHTEFFSTIDLRADVRLFALCAILGVTTWTTLCRLLRAETLKLSEMDYVHAANCLGVSTPKIILRHIVPNLMHIILITIAMDFSVLVLAEAVLSYVGVGVDPSTYSFGNMINRARSELAREPVVWWSLSGAFIFMFALVLSANIFENSVRDALDPRNNR